MKSSRTQFSKILLLLSGIVLWIAVLALIYHKSQSELYKQIANVWKQSITSDCQRRLIETGMKYTSFTPLNRDSSGSITMKTEKRIIELDRKDTVTPQNEEEQRLRGLQFLLFQANPVKVNRLDSLFQANLQDKSLSIPTAVSYSYRDTSNTQLHQFTCPINTLLSGSYTVYKIETSVDNSLVLCGYTQLSWIDYIENEKTIFLLWFGCGLAFILTINFYRKRPVFKIISENPVETSDYKIVYRHFDRTLICNNTTVTFTTLQGELFNILLTGKNYQSNYENMIQALWPSGEGDKKKLEQQQKRLKERLKQFPIHIEIVRGTGYYLEIDEPYTIAEE